MRLSSTKDFESAKSYLIGQCRETWETFEKRFLELAVTKTNDPAFAVPAYQQKFLSEVLADSIGYAGTELIRRTIGLAHVEDIEGIPNEKERARAERRAVELGRELILASATGPTIEVVEMLAGEICAP